MSETKPALWLIVAIGPNRAIGRGGKLPWHIPEDLKHFKQATLGHAIIMGRKTFESIGRALPGRRNIVVSRSRRDFADEATGKAHPDGVEVFATFDEALRRAHETDSEPRVIGGGEIYRDAMPFVTELHVTSVAPEASGDVSDCDAFFPEIDDAIFELVEELRFATPGVTLRRYRRRG